MSECEDGLLDCSDLESSYNLFAVPDQFVPYFDYALFVESTHVGLEGPGRKTWVALMVLPIGWLSAVSLMQSVLRCLTFVHSEVPRASEDRKGDSAPCTREWTVLYLDSFDLLRFVDGKRASLLSGKASPVHARFVETCRRLGLPLNQAKELVGA
jgi:hypothetical protein